MSRFKLSEVNLNLVKSYLQIDYTDDDLQLELMIDAAKSYLYDNINCDPEYLDTKPDLVVACLQIISHFYENKSIVVATNTKLDMMLQSILIQYREWVTLWD